MARGQSISNSPSNKLCILSKHSSQNTFKNRKPLLVEIEQYQLTIKYVGWKCCGKISHPNLCQHPGKLSVMEWHHQWRWFFCEECVCKGSFFPMSLSHSSVWYPQVDQCYTPSTYRRCHTTSPGVWLEIGTHGSNHSTIETITYYTMPTYSQLHWSVMRKNQWLIPHLKNLFFVQAGVQTLEWVENCKKL